MVCSKPPVSQAGYATPAAVAVSMAIAVIATAITQRSALELKFAKSDLQRDQIEYALAGSQQLAALGVLGSHKPGRLRWTLPSDLGPIGVLAEPEAQKLPPAASDALNDRMLAALAVVDADSLRSRLIGLPKNTRALDSKIELADASSSWRACVHSIVSPYGEAATLSLTQAQQPSDGQPTWRIGEVWRIRVSAPNGWNDERIVRFTGDLNHPAAVVERRFSRRKEGGEQCENLFDRAPAL